MMSESEKDEARDRNLTLKQQKGSCFPPLAI
jgi:hypothetical protein